MAPFGQRRMLFLCGTVLYRTWRLLSTVAHLSATFTFTLPVLSLIDFPVLRCLSLSVGDMAVLTKMDVCVPGADGPVVTLCRWLTL